MVLAVSPLHMVLAALPSLGAEALTLAKETALVRWAVLYADTIDLISPTGSLLSVSDRRTAEHGRGGFERLHIVTIGRRFTGSGWKKANS